MRNLKPALDLIKEFEGLRLKAYLDPVGLPTIGWGNTRYQDGKPVKMGDEITQEQADEMLLDDVAVRAEKLEDLIEVQVNDHQFGALVSFAYNVGIGAFTNSTLRRKLNAGDYEGASNEFKRWNKAGGKVLNGLVRRRKAEKDLFNKPVEAVSVPDDVDQEELSPAWALLKQILELIVAFFSPKTPKNDPKTPEKKTYSKGNGPRITREEVKKILEANGADTNQVCLLGVRGYYLDSMGVEGKNDRGIYDDALIWFLPDGFMTYRANTDPSRYRKGYGTSNSTKGMASLKTGKWSYKMGMHNGSVPHQAFRQAEKVTVIRDGNPNYPDTGWFGINIHRGGNTGTSSLGCQTVPKETWDSFKRLGYAELEKYDQKTFDYVLIDEESRR